ncbi:hypothetical protein IWW57_001353 [Coemansia sp. S610]|nr:hypothetical protein GGI06_002925 [Coemansia sp. S85]KAJ2030088.1 hypothetical protein IWW57_001353 [Coemansia sp. S610]KAJ2416147.1 hypothetical protein GGI10_001195 [Coemansia sp. RSA 2530]
MPTDWQSLEQWLKQLYAPSQPPLITKDSKTQQQLSQLYLLSQPVHEAQKLVERVQSEATSEYVALSSHIQTILRTAGVSLGDLSTATTKALADMSAIASDLGLSDMRIESFERAVTEATMAGFKREQQLEAIKTQAAAIGRQTRASQERQARLRLLLEERTAAAPIEEQKTREWLRNADIIAQKSGEYRQRLNETEAETDKLRVHERGLEYAQLSQLNASVCTLSDVVQEKQRMNDGYAALPPDISLAHLKLEEAKLALEQLRIECENAAAAAFSSG